VNVPNAGYVGVVDRETGTVIEKFPLKESARANFPMALDEADHRLFIAAAVLRSSWYWKRRPARTVATVDIVGDTAISSTTRPISESMSPEAKAAST